LPCLMELSVGLILRCRSVRSCNLQRQTSP
jgi:hypothetical protein